MGIRSWHQRQPAPQTEPQGMAPRLLPPSDLQRRGVVGDVIPHDGVPPTILDTVTTVSRPEADPYRSGPGTYKALPSNFVPARAPRTRFYDPLTLMYATGYKDRRFSISYDTLRRVSYQLSLVGAVINTRVSQIASFAQPYRENKQIGFAIRYKDESYIPSDGDKQALRELEQMVMRCGFQENKFTPFPRDDFEIFLRKIVRDSLVFDQACFEIIPDRMGQPAEFRAVDASTIRLAATYEGPKGSEASTFDSRQFSPHWRRLHGDEFSVDKTSIHTVQVMHGRIENVFAERDMAFCVRNPRTDIWVNGYGFSELEMCLNTVLGMLWGEEYNRRFFQQGSAPKGILNIKGDTISPEELESFRRQWYAQVSGVENAWRTPVIQADGMEYQNLQSTNKEMEFQKWLEYLLKIVTAVYMIDPSEINFDIVGGGSGKAPMFEAKHEWKIKHSKDKGLRPLLRSVAKWLSYYIIDPLDNRLYLDFVGLDEMSEQDRVELITKQTKSFKTINESRMDEGLPPLPGGDIIDSQTFITAWQAEQEKQQDAAAQLAPWMTTEDALPPEYGDAPAIPLYMQPKTPDPEEQQQGMPGMEGGDEGGPPPGM